jgi:hypothetical protein
MTYAQAAEISGVTRQAIAQAVLRGELKDIRIAGRPFVDQEEVRIWRQRPRAGVRGRRPKAAAHS